MEAFLQPFPISGLSDPFVCRQIPLQWGLSRYGMGGGIVLPDVFKEHPVEFFQRLYLGYVNPIQPAFFQCPEVPLHLFSEHSEKK